MLFRMIKSGIITANNINAANALFGAQRKWHIGNGHGSKRYLWGWLNSIFNRSKPRTKNISPEIAIGIKKEYIWPNLRRVDQSRIDEVGANRACAEWLLRCGAAVKWDKGQEWLKDYNSLPLGHYRTLNILEIDATDSAIMQIGFPHLRGLKHVRKVILHKCGYLEDEAVIQLRYIKGSLKDLQISSNGNITDEGIRSIKNLSNLENLYLYDLLDVRDRKACLAELKQALPNCKINFPYARESDKDKSGE